MYKDLRKIEVRGDELFILNKQGHVASIPKELKVQLETFAGLENLSPDAPEFIKQLADAQILEFKNYNPNDENLFYDDSLINSNGDQPIYPGPVIAHLAITNKCNMKCKYCSVRDAHEKISDELSTNEYKQIIDKLVQWGAFQIGLTGGEPTLRADVVELVKYISDKRVACNMTTNGWNITPQFVEILKQAGLNQVQVSLDSYKKETHERFRSRGSYERALNAIKSFKDAGLIVGVDCVVSNNNLDDVEEFMDFLESIGVDGLTIIKLKQGDLPLEIFKQQIPDYKKYSELVAKVCKRWEKPLEVTIDCASVSNLCATLTEEEQNQLHSAGCPAGHTLISIAPNGDMYPCAALTNDKYKVGNILKDDPKELWYKSETLKRLRNIKNEVSGKCSKCAKLDVCRGGCRGIADSLNEPFGSDVNCENRVS